MDNRRFEIHYIALNGERSLVSAERGQNLRLLLLDNRLGPYTRITKNLNCGGRGLCATCGVWLLENDELSPVHWHDKAAKSFGYPRLSCQITIDRDLMVYEVDKWVWGNRRSKDRDMMRSK